MASRPLTSEELAVARSVFQDVLDYSRVHITDIQLGGAVTTCLLSLDDGKYHYYLNWGHAVFTSGVIANNERSTLVHELTHVWQGHYGAAPGRYMAQSVIAQLDSGIRDAWNKGERDPRRVWRNWDDHRSTAYVITPADFGRDWKTFNVEQQGMLVQTWYVSELDRRREQVSGGPGVVGGGASPYDPRYPYIRDVILRRDRNAPYRPVELPRGADPEIKQIQDRLVALGYLDPNAADGLLGRSHSATLDAVRAFQAANGLQPDRDLGGPNSETRRKLAQPAGLVPAHR